MNDISHQYVVSVHIYPHSHVRKNGQRVIGQDIYISRLFAPGGKLAPATQYIGTYLESAGQRMVVTIVVPENIKSTMDLALDLGEINAPERGKILWLGVARFYSAGHGAKLYVSRKVWDSGLQKPWAGKGIAYFWAKNNKVQAYMLVDIPYKKGEIT